MKAFHGGQSHGVRQRKLLDFKIGFIVVVGDGNGQDRTPVRE